jgi:hypothetical protein
LIKPFRYGQNSNDYVTTTFKEINPDDIKSANVDPKSIQHLLIENLGEILRDDPKRYEFKKFKNLHTIFILGNDMDEVLQQLPQDLLKLKSLKIIFLERVIFIFPIIHQVKNQARYTNKYN